MDRKLAALVLAGSMNARPSLDKTEVLGLLLLLLMANLLMS